jgi:hypothetical protein
MRRGACAGHWRGSKKGAGRVGGRRGREIWRRARVRTRRSTTSEGKAELTRQAHGAEREERGSRGNDSAISVLGPRDRERESERVKETGADRSAPLAASERGRVRARQGTATDRRGPPVKRRGRVAWLGCFLLFFFSGFSNSVSISFL